MEFKALGHAVRESQKTLEVFDRPKYVTRVVMKSDEVTSLCPVTGQPDWDTVMIEYEPAQKCIESKSLKLYLQSFRNEGHFCEDMSRIILEEVIRSAEPRSASVTVFQKSRGGVTIESTAQYPTKNDCN